MNHAAPARARRWWVCGVDSQWFAAAVVASARGDRTDDPHGWATNGQIEPGEDGHEAGA